MSKLLAIMIPSLILAALAELNSSYELDELGAKKYICKDKIFFTLMTIIMVSFVGLRTGYNDTTAYTHAYEMLNVGLEAFKEIDWSLGMNPGFKVVNTCLKTLGISTQSFLMLYAIGTISTYVWFIRKYTTNIWLSIFLLFAMGCYTFTLAAIKQTVAVAFCLIATDRALEKRWLSFILYIFIAATFHPYALIYLIIPILMFKPWSIKTYITLTICFGLGIGLQPLLGTLIDITTMLGEEYTVETFSRDGVNIFRVLVVWVPIILSFFAREFLKECDDKNSNLIINLSMINAGIMFIGLFGTANYFARLANYFLIFQTMALPSVFKYYNRSSKKLLILGAIVGYSAYCYYAYGILYGGIDAQYRGISILEYLSSLI